MARFLESLAAAMSKRTSVKQSTFPSFTGSHLEVAEDWRKEAANSVNGARETFFKKRNEFVRLLWPNGGSPDAEKLWDDAGGLTPDTVIRKRLHCALKTVIKKVGKDEKLLQEFRIPTNYEVSLDLKAIIESAIARCGS
jgi:hypothetical protein